MKPLLETVREGRILVADGAMGTMLMADGLGPGDCPERVNLERPETLVRIAQSYRRAGADIVQTNTFGGSALKLAQYHLDDRTEEINAAAVQAVRRAVDSHAYVSGSCGPSGQLLKPLGDVDTGQMSASFRRQISALVEAGVDVLCVETMTDLTEAQIAIQIAREVAPTVPVMATMTFDATPRGYFTVMGVSIEQAVAGLTEAGAEVIGSNCGNGIDNMLEIAVEFRKHTDLPLLIQSNAGLPKLQDGVAVYPEAPRFMAARVDAMIRSGVNIIGGCCGTTPEHIAAVRAAVDEAIQSGSEPV